MARPHCAVHCSRPVEHHVVSRSGPRRRSQVGLRFSGQNKLLDEIPAGKKSAGRPCFAMHHTFLRYAAPADSSLAAALCAVELCGPVEQLDSQEMLLARWFACLCFLTYGCLGLVHCASPRPRLAAMLRECSCCCYELISLAEMPNIRAASLPCILPFLLPYLTRPLDTSHG